MRFVEKIRILNMKINYRPEIDGSKFVVDDIIKIIKEIK